MFRSGNFNRRGLALGLTTKPDRRKLQVQPPRELSQDANAVVADDDWLCPLAGSPVPGRPVRGRRVVTTVPHAGRDERDSFAR